MGNPSPGRGLTFYLRALLAIGLLVGYYALAFVVAFVALLAAAVLVLLAPSSEQLPFWPVVMALCVAGVSLWTAANVFFTSDDKIVPGVAISRESEPELHRFVDGIAKELDLGGKVALRVLDRATAFAIEEVGLFGFRRTRTVGIGYPLLRSLRRDELRAIVAHELAHFAAGDTIVSLVFARVHRNVARSVEMLHVPSRARMFLFSLVRVALGAALRAYGRLVLRVTAAMSRREELEADRRAVAIVGAPTYRRALERSVALDATLDTYFATEVDLLFAVEAWPDDFWGGYERLEALALRREAVETEPSPYETHPSIADRLAFADSLPAPSITATEDSEPASTLLADPPALWETVERRLAGRLPRVPWSEVATHRGKRVRRMADELKPAFRALAGGASWLELVEGLLRTLAESGARPIVFAASPKLRHAGPKMWEAAGPLVLARSFGAVLAMALLTDGGAFVHTIGQPLAVRWRGVVVEPTALAAEAGISVEGLARANELARAIADREAPAPAWLTVS